MRDISSKEDIALIVSSFYKKAMKDRRIGVFFNEVVALDLDQHLPVITEFWSTTLLHDGEYKGNPMIKHLEINEKKKLESAHFERWLGLWEETVKSLFKGKKAEEAVLRAQQIGGLMKYKVEQQNK